ncbi:CU044_5270 family protein [Planotetraspora silvatica]|uniref:CU044_5270 family protein n=1 Tax=Planotetraspora silvatica TaxID=234614 RepID=UPI00194FBC7A|nr:CU044_5270 family protein [Planotetraspora silvatica]
MNELKTLDDLGTALDPASASPPERLRRRVLAETARETGRAGFRLPRLTMPTMGWRIAAAGGLAAALTAGVLTTQVVNVGGNPPASTASAAVRILQGAASEARNRPAVAVRGDQFVYAESITTAIGMSQGQGSGPGDMTVISQRRQAWLSVDGTQDGMIRERPGSGGGTAKVMEMPGCRDGIRVWDKGGKVGTQPCEPEAHYRRDLPTDADGMLAELRRAGGDTRNPRDQDAFNAAGDLIREAYIAPASLAAVFDAVARIPGVTVVGEVTDEAGRTGVAVALTQVQGSRTELIFDARTHAFLGERSTQVRNQDGLKAGQVLDSTAVLKIAIVDRAGQTS